MVRQTRTIKFLILGIALAACVMAKANPRAGGAPGFELKMPLGISADVWAYFVPKDNPLTAAKVELGKQLFFDMRLSADASLSCASCHDPKLAFTDGKVVSDGINGRRGKRNSPTLLNAMFNSGQFWDGRAVTLEEQATQPLINPDEMGNENLAEVVARLQKIPEYQVQFRKVFETPVTPLGIARALAAFERTLVAGDAPFDRFHAGERDAMSDAAKRGLLVFRQRARCNICHTINPSFPFLTDNSFRNTGVAANHGSFESLTRRAVDALKSDTSTTILNWLVAQEGGSELGRFAVTGNSLDIGAFRTPSLRNVELTAPYFHDGSAASLAEVLRYYVKGGNANALRDWELQALELTDDEQKDLIEFLKSLTSTSARTTYDAGLVKKGNESTRTRDQR
jgi:cytochrome c peroxidase